MSKVITIIALGLLAYYWALTQKLKTTALQAARYRCREAGVQLLDHTVVQNKIRLVRSSSKRWQVERVYSFDFTSTGEHRYQGTVTLHGKHVIATELEAFSIN